MSEVKNSAPLKILIVGGHPADVFDNAGGTLLNHVQQGDTVKALVMTHGMRQHDVVISEKIESKKEVLIVFLTVKKM